MLTWLDIFSGKKWSVRCTNKNQIDEVLTCVRFTVLPIIQKEELMGWIVELQEPEFRVIEVNSSELLIKWNEI